MPTFQTPGFMCRSVTRSDQVRFTVTYEGCTFLSHDHLRPGVLSCSSLVLRVVLQILLYECGVFQQHAAICPEPDVHSRFRLQTSLLPCAFRFVLNPMYIRESNRGHCFGGCCSIQMCDRDRCINHHFPQGIPAHVARMLDGKTGYIRGHLSGVFCFVHQVRHASLSNGILFSVAFVSWWGGYLSCVGRRLCLWRAGCPMFRGRPWLALWNSWVCTDDTRSLLRELGMQQLGTCLDSLPHLNMKMRAIRTDWLVSVAANYKLRPFVVLYGASDQQYLDRRPVHWNVVAGGFAAMLFALKFETFLLQNAGFRVLH